MALLLDSWSSPSGSLPGAGFLTLPAAPNCISAWLVVGGVLLGSVAIVGLLLVQTRQQLEQQQLLAWTKDMPPVYSNRVVFPIRLLLAVIFVSVFGAGILLISGLAVLVLISWWMPRMLPVPILLAFLLRKTLTPDPDGAAAPPTSSSSSTLH